MVNEKQYESKLGDARGELNMVLMFYWRIPFLVLAALIASLPFYGYYVHASRDSQQTFIWITLCWLLNLIFVVTSIVFAIVRPPSSQTIRLTAIFLTLYLLIAAIIGWGGVCKAMDELAAG